MPCQPESALRRLSKDRGGNFSQLFAAAAVVIFMSAGVAVEFTRAINEKSAMANALDAAVLATARSISTGDLAIEDAETFLRRMFVANMQLDEGELSKFDIENVTFDNTTKTVSATATHDFSTRFRFFGANNDSVVKTGASATYGSSDAEVAMTFDVTDSMAGSKIRDLKNAAKEGIALLLEKNREGEEKVRISAVPYAEAVNVGALSRYVFPEDGQNPNLEPPTLAAFEAAMESGDPPAHWEAADDDCATERKGDHIYDPDGPDIAMVNRDDRLYECPDAALIPLSHDKEALIDLVDDMSLAGFTAGHIGIQWAWYTLSPEWAEFLPAGAEPIDPEDPDADVRKYAIIMTDGEFNTAYAGANYNTRGGQSKLASQRAVELCARMKARDIEVFTIGFDLDNYSAITMLKKCATPDRGNVKFFYDASSGAELIDAYREIASTIQALRLVK